MAWTVGQMKLWKKHGTPDDFEAACGAAFVQCMVTFEEAQCAVQKYRREWGAAGEKPRPAGPTPKAEPREGSGSCVSTPGKPAGIGPGSSRKNRERACTRAARFNDCHPEYPFYFFGRRGRSCPS